MSQERRKHPRCALPRPVQVLYADDRSVAGTLSDLCADGLRLRAAAPGALRDAAQHELLITLPAGWAELPELDVTARRRWRAVMDVSVGSATGGAEHSRPGVEEAGFEIIDISDTEAFLLREILDLYGAPLQH